MKKINKLTNKLLSKGLNYTQVKSLFEIECFLRKATNIKKSLALAKNLNYISHKQKWH